MVIEQSPSIAASFGFGQQQAKSADEILAVIVPEEDIATCDTTEDYVLQQPRAVEARVTGHVGRLPGNGEMQRTSPLVPDVSQIPAIAEPWFLAFNAGIEIQPAMKPEDLGKAEGAIAAAVKKYR